YFQCLPGSASPTTTTTRTTTSTSSSTPTSTPSTAPIPSYFSPKWKAAYAKAQAALPKISLRDKINLATGLGWQKGRCLGNVPAISAINFPGLCLQDSPLGIRFADLVSAFPAGINAAATFNRTLIRQRGVALGEEFRGKGVHVTLGPAMNIHRAPAAGRNWEGFGADPYQSGEAAYETIIGIQSTGVQANAKHYINNEQEHFRETSSSNVDDRIGATYSLNPPQFIRSIQADVASVMCSYNQINGTYACENEKVLNGLLKGEFGFPGFVMSDWWATHSTQSVNKGLDMTMPGDITLGSGTTYFGDVLYNAVQSGSVPQSRIDDLATRILAGWYLLGQDSGYTALNFDSWNVNDPFNQHVNVQGDHKNSLIRTIGAASTVLLKNTGNTLPLKNPRSIAIIGNGAGPGSKGPNGYEDRAGTDGVLAMGNGTAQFPYLIDPLQAISARARQQGTTISSTLSDSDLNTAASVAAGKEVAFVFITANSGEGYLTVEGKSFPKNTVPSLTIKYYIRACWRSQQPAGLAQWDEQDALVARVASVNPRTVVVVNSVGPIIMEPWINHPNITAVVWSGLPGQEAGNALVDVLYGDYNPSGRLPYTIGKATSDYGAQVIYNSGGQITQIPYNDGLFVDYRHFDKNNISPRFEFGFGLSYTTFAYSSLSVSGSIGTGTAPSGPGSSLDPWLHEQIVTVTFSLTNSGSVAGHEIPQLYINLPASSNSPPKSLKGFDSIYLTPGQTKTVTMKLSRFDLSIWDVSAQRWQIPSGTIGIQVGASSRDIRLTGTVAHPESSFSTSKKVRGDTYLQLQPERVAMQDASAQMALLQFMSAGLAQCAVPTSIHCDHLIQAVDGANSDLERSIVTNQEVFDFLQSAAQKYGIEFWKPGSGIIHQIVLENYAAPGMLMLGTDSHTPNAGGLGMLAIGVGGADAVDAMTGTPWELKAPNVIGVHLTGKLNGWATPKDLILHLAGKLTVRGGTGSILEYFGPGVENQSCTGLATIANMGAEVGATTSTFPYSANMRSYLKATGRSAVAAAADEAASKGFLSADKGAEYDNVIEINLSELEPTVNGPFTPDLATPLSKFGDLVKEKGWKDEISAGLIGSCTNSSYEDMTRVADLARQAKAAGIKTKVPFLCTPGSEQIRATMERDGVTSSLEDVGALVLANACGPCIGQWKRDDKKGEENSILTSFNRNFKSRNDGNNLTMNFLASPTIVTAMAFSGKLSFNPQTDSLTLPNGESFKFSPPQGQDLPSEGFTPGDRSYYPAPMPTPQPEVEVVIKKDSQRLEILEPFGTHFTAANPRGLELPPLKVLLRVRGKCTTDHISAAGPWLKYKGHLTNISENLLITATNDEGGEMNVAFDKDTNTSGTIPEIAKRFKSRDQPWALIVDDNYGEGSAREHAALQPRFYGCAMILARSFARIHETNLKKQGILPLWFVNKDDYSRIGSGDVLETIGLADVFAGKPDAVISIKVTKADGSVFEVPTKHTMSVDQLKWLKAGSALNHIRSSMN
ncbi:hypothetical protein CVT24_000856, partial [Panaeolus cyanescens]